MRDGQVPTVSTPSRSPPEEIAERARAELGYSRWWQIVAAVLMMALVSPYQYVWSSLEGPLAASLDTSLATIGFVFTVYVVVMSLSQFPAGWWRDRYGPRWLSMFAGIIAGGGYVGTALATEIWQLYLAYAVGSVGVGIVYTVAVNTAVKWFPDRRGLTTGLGTMAFGAGGALFVPYVRANAAPEALGDALLTMGVLVGVGVLVGAIVLRDPPRGWSMKEPRETNEPREPNASASRSNDPAMGSNAPVSSNEDASTVSSENGNGTTRSNSNGSTDDHRSRQYAWRETVRTWQFWMMYVMFVFVSAAGLMITARIVLFGEHVQLSAVVVTLAATMLPIASGGGRLVVGAISDRMRREVAMAVSFLVCGTGTLAIVAFGAIDSPMGFVLAVAVAVFFWSSQFSLFPSTVADYYGTQHSSTNYALLYSAKMWGGVFGGGVVGWLVGVVGWSSAFALGGVLALLAGIFAFTLRPPPRSSVRHR